MVAALIFFVFLCRKWYLNLVKKSGGYVESDIKNQYIWDYILIPIGICNGHVIIEVNV